ncbi:MAG: hypothetical protein WCX82_03015 [archaeon]
MKKAYLLSVIFLIAIIVQSVSAVPFNINYSYVNTDSQNQYLNVQYGNYYDNVNLRLRLQATDGYSNVPVVVSPKVYGILDGGQLTYLYSIPTQTYYVYPTPQDYTYSNVFYLNPSYQGYVVKVYAESAGVVYNTYSQAYVYPVNTDPYFYPVDDTDNEETEGTTDAITDCSDFYLSGAHDIYFDEDEERTYNLYIENEAGDDLEVFDVDTSNPSELDIDDIEYPDTVPESSVRTVRLTLQADTVGDDYESTFDVTVSAKYDNTSVCTKTYEVEYHINDLSNDNDSSCSDISFDDTSFTINDNTATVKNIVIENSSEDYDFEIDDITVEDRDDISARIVDEPDAVDQEDSENIEIEFDPDNLTYTATRYLDLEVVGNLVRDGHDDKECTKRANLAITIVDNGNSSSGNTNNNTTLSSCKNLSIYAANISQEEGETNNYSRNNGFFIVNNANSEFTITNLTVNDNSSYANVTNTNYNPSVYSKNLNAYSFDLTTNNVDIQQNSKGTVSVSGRFADGRGCSSSDIGVKQFDISIFEPESESCAGIEVESKNVLSGNNQINIYNHTNKKFYVSDVLFQNKYGLIGNVNNKQLTVQANNSSSMTVGLSGTGSLEMLISGKFEDGKKCTFLQTNSGFLTTGNTNIQANLSSTDCGFEVIAPTAITVNNSQETITATFKNLTSKNGRVEITGNGLTTDPSIIFLSGFDNFTQNITLSNFSNPTSVYYTVKLNDCSVTRTFTNIVNNISETERISLLSYPTLISPTSSYVVVMVGVNNSFSVNKNVTLKLSGFPSNFQTSPKTTTLGAHETKNVSLDLIVSENAEKIAYNGYIELYTDNALLNKYPITINLSPAVSPMTATIKTEKIVTEDRSYNLTLTLRNNTNVIQETVVDFGLDETYTIEGEKQVNILSGEETVKKYKIVSSVLLKEDKVIDVRIRDKATAQELTSVKTTLQSGASPLSGFLTLGNAGLIILGLIILVVLVIIFRRR